MQEELIKMGYPYKEAVAIEVFAIQYDLLGEPEDYIAEQYEKAIELPLKNKYSRDICIDTILYDALMEGKENYGIFYNEIEKAFDIE